MQKNKSNQNNNISTSKRMISNFAGQANNGIQNNKVLVNLISHNKKQISRNKNILFKYSQSQETASQMAKSLYLELKKENQLIQENNLKLIKEIQKLKEKVKYKLIKLFNIEIIIIR